MMRAATHEVDDKANLKRMPSVLPNEQVPLLIKCGFYSPSNQSQPIKKAFLKKTVFVYFKHLNTLKQRQGHVENLFMVLGAVTVVKAVVDYIFDTTYASLMHNYLAKQTVPITV